MRWFEIWILKLKPTLWKPEIPRRCFFCGCEFYQLPSVIKMRLLQKTMVLT